MKNLKRVLSLGLASVMLLGMMVMGASAADFSDADKIDNTAAVNFMVALGVITGNDDGTFAPDRTVSRAEMATMITKALNGGTVPPLGTSSVSYTDTASHWAKNQIEYCTNLKIVSGRGNGIFDPDAPVTGSEAAKMILVAMGYKSEWYGFTGNDWEINVNTEANRITVPVAGSSNSKISTLYAGLPSNFNPSAALSRDDAAQMIYNGVNGEILELTNINQGIGNNADSSASYGKMGNTILTSKFGANVEYGTLNHVTYDDESKEYTYSITPAANEGYSVVGGTADFAEDVSKLFKQNVEIVWIGTDTDPTILGIYASNSKVLTSGVVGKLPTIAAADESFKLNGTTYRLEGAANTIPVYAFNVSASVGTLNAYETATTEIYNFDLIDTNNNNKADLVVAYPVTAAQVSFVSKTSVTAGTSYKFEEADIYDGIAKNDFAIITNKTNTANDTPVLTKAETVTGTVTATNANGQVRVNGTWYNVAATPASGTPANVTPAVGNEVEMQLVNGYVVYSKNITTAANLNEILYVVDSDKGTGNYGDVIAANFAGKFTGKDTKVLMADGTNTIVKAMRVDVTTATSGVSAGSSDMKKAIPAPDLYTYTVNDDGVYELKAVKDDGHPAVGSNYALDAANIPTNLTLGSATGKDESSTFAYVKSEGKLDGKFIADDAVIYINTTDNGGKQKVVSGKELKAMASIGTDATYLTESVSGLPTVRLAVINSAIAIPGTSEGIGYGYVTADSYAEKDGNNWTIHMTVWTVDGEQELTVVTSNLNSTSVNAAQYKKGAFVEYTTTATAGEITGVQPITTETSITGWDGSKNIALTGINSGNPVSFKDDNKTVVIYVNTADVTGVEGGSINLAAEVSTGVYQKNAVVKMDTNPATEVKVLFVDVNNSLAGATYTIAAPDPWSNAGVAGITAIANSGVTATPTTGKAGDSVNLNLTLTGTVSGNGATITATFTCADGTTFTASKAVSVGAGAEQSIAFTMPAQPITGITFNVVAISA